MREFVLPCLLGREPGTVTRSVIKLAEKKGGALAGRMMQFHG
jgi:hypothetical protein